MFDSGTSGLLASCRVLLALASMFSSRSVHSCSKLREKVIVAGGAARLASYTV
jgi:hypothetical protein